MLKKKKVTCPCSSMKHVHLGGIQHPCIFLLNGKCLLEVKRFPGLPFSLVLEGSKENHLKYHLPYTSTTILLLWQRGVRGMVKM